MARALNPMQRKFCVEFVKTGNATKAAISAGYSAATASVTGSQMTRKPLVAAEIARLRGKVEKKTAVTLDRLLEEVAHSALFDPGELFDADGNEIPIHQLPEHVRRAIASIETDKDYRKLKMVSKTTSQELLAKLAGWVKQEQNAQQAVQIIIQPAPGRPESIPTAKEIRPEWD